MSLKEKLHAIIREKGMITYSELISICERERYKIDTARRRLDELQDVESHKKKSIRGSNYTDFWLYKNASDAVKSIESIPSRKPTKPQTAKLW